MRRVVPFRRLEPDLCCVSKIVVNDHVCSQDERPSHFADNRFTDRTTSSFSSQIFDELNNTTSQILQSYRKGVAEEIVRSVIWLALAISLAQEMVLDTVRVWIRIQQ